MAESKPPTEGEAWKRFPDAESTQGACTGAKLVDGAATEWNSRWTSRIFASPENQAKVQIEVAQKALEGIPEGDREKIPNSAKIFLAERVPNTKEGDDVRAKLLHSARIGDMGYVSWENERHAKMLRALDADPLVAEAQKRWSDPSFSQDDKLRVAERIHQIQMEAFGAKTEQIVPEFDEKNNGSHNAKNKRIYLSTAPGAGVNQPKFDDFVDTVTHESIHGVQSQIAERDAMLRKIDKETLDTLGVKSTAELTADGLKVYEAERTRKRDEAFPGGDASGWNKELGEDGRLAGIAPMFRYQIQEGGYMSHERSGGQNYFENPIEKHAFIFGYQTGKFIAADADERKSIIERKEAFNEMDKGIHERKLEERKTSLPSTKPCS